MRERPGWRYVTVSPPVPLGARKGSVVVPGFVQQMIDFDVGG